MLASLHGLTEKLPAQTFPNHPAERRQRLLIGGLLILYAAGLLIYSQTMAFVWDEGFHILAAQLIDRGETPYIDFCFPQTPLNAYWNAGWMAIFGQSWRVIHVVAAIEMIAAVFLIVHFVFTRFPIPGWRLAGALTAGFFVALSSIVVQFGPCAQAYAFGMFFSVAAFRITVAGASKRSWVWPLTAGLLAGIAADSSLLTAPVVPVLLLWILLNHRNGSRWFKGGSFVSGVLIAFAPVFWLFAEAPRQVFFNVVQYQAIYRRVNWHGATPHDVDVLSAWLADAQSLFLGLLAVAGIWFVAKRSNWDRTRRSEYVLCAWLSLALVLYISTAHPTFTRYFLFAIPFLAALAAVGLYLAGSRLADRERPLWPTAFVIAFVVLALARSLFDDRDAVTWYDYQEIARKVDEVTPPNARLFADELVYFLTKRPPPPGMEFSYSHEIQLPPDQEKLYHVISKPELFKEVKEGKFYTVENCKDDWIEDMNLASLFPHKTDVADCSIFWGKVKTPAAKPRK